MCWYEEPRFRVLYPEYNNLGERELQEKLYHEVLPGRKFWQTHENSLPAPRPAQPWNLLMFVAIVAFGVPLALLTMGQRWFGRLPVSSADLERTAFGYRTVSVGRSTI